MASGNVYRCKSNIGPPLGINSSLLHDLFIWVLCDPKIVRTVEHERASVGVSSGGLNYVCNRKRWVALVRSPMPAGEENKRRAYLYPHAP